MDMTVNAASPPYQLLWEHFPPHPPMHVHTPACTYALEKVTESLGWGQLLLAQIVVVEDLAVSDCSFSCSSAPVSGYFHLGTL